MKISLLCLMLTSISIAATAQTGILKGRVVNVNNNPVASASILLNGTSYSTTTNEQGFYRLQAPEGNYSLIITAQGFGTARQSVGIRNYEMTTVPVIILKKSTTQLQEVVINGSKTNQFAIEQSDDIAKIPLNRLENPQVYTTITKELLAEQMVFSVDDAIKNAPGVTTMWEATGRGGDGGSYYNSRGFIMQSQLRNGVAGNVSSRIDAANLERIEVIKGPSATLFGNSLTSYGGLINRITKKPYQKFGGAISYSAGNFGFNRLSADINSPLDSAKNVLLRINTAYNYEGSFQDNGFNKNFAFAPSLSYKVNDKLSFLLDAEFYSGENTGMSVFFFPYGQTIASLGATSADELKIDYKRSYTNEDLFQTSRNTNFFGQMNYRISEKWHSQTNITVTNSFSDGPSPYFYLLSNAAVTGDPADIGNDYISRNDQFTDNSKDRVIEFQQNFNGDFKIGNLRNRFVGGIDIFYHDADQFFAGGTLDTIDVTLASIPNYRDFNRTNMDKLYETKGMDFTYPIIFTSATYSAYVADVLSLTDKLEILAALRVDHFANNGNFDEATGKTSGGYNQTALSPKFGIVYQPVKDKVSLFGNYQNGFTNQEGEDHSGKAFRPEQANQLEGGIKLNLFDGKLSSTFSYYDIKVKDIIRPDAANPNFSIQDGTQLSKGVEAEIIANPFRGMNMVAGFSYNDSKYEKADADVTGRRPGTASSPYTANLWLSYRLLKGALKGLGFGFGGNYASDNVIINSVSEGKFTLPAYTLLDAAAFYDQPKFRFSVKIDNITNQKYWIGYTTVNPQPLRSMKASVEFKF